MRVNNLLRTLLMATLLAIAMVPIGAADDGGTGTDGGQDDPEDGTPCFDVVPYPPYILWRDDC